MVDTNTKYIITKHTHTPLALVRLSTQRQVRRRVGRTFFSMVIDALLLKFKPQCLHCTLVCRMWFVRPVLLAATLLHPGNEQTNDALEEANFASLIVGNVFLNLDRIFSRLLI